MERSLRYAQWVLVRACVVLGAAAVVIGCHHAAKDDCADCHGHSHGGWDCLHIDNCADIPKGAIPQPPGTYTNEYLNREAGKAEGDDFTIYYNEWVDGQAVLGPFGGEHLDRIIARLPFVPFQVVIQPEPNLPILNGLRHKAMIEALTEAGFKDAAKRVVVGRPAAEGLFGEEAERIYPQMIHGGFAGNAGGGLGLPYGGYGMAGLGFTGGGFGGFAGGGFGGFGGGGFGGFGGGFGFR
jgi:hypothetical protein